MEAKRRRENRASDRWSAARRQELLCEQFARQECHSYILIDFNRASTE